MAPPTREDWRELVTQEKPQPSGKGQVPPQPFPFQPTDPAGMEQLLQETLQRTKQFDIAPPHLPSVHLLFGKKIETLTVKCWLPGEYARSLPTNQLRSLIARTLADKLLAEIAPMLEINEDPPEFDRDERTFYTRVHIALRNP